VYARYPTTKYMPSVDAACVCECGGPTHDERRRAIKSHEWRLSNAAGACVGVRTLPNDQVHAICRCSMRVGVRRAHARRAAPCNQIARMAPQRRRWGPVWANHSGCRSILRQYSVLDSVSLGPCVVHTVRAQPRSVARFGSAWQVTGIASPHTCCVHPSLSSTTHHRRGSRLYGLVDGYSSRPKPR
jgi:hypothetical protein